MIVFQLLILFGMVTSSMYPLIVGKEIQLKVRPIDPRDFMRGNYVALGYNFNTISFKTVQNHLDTSRIYTHGTPVYLELVKKNKFYEPVAVWGQRPKGSKTVLQVIVHTYYDNYLRVNSGIDSYFTDAQQAKEIEEAVRQRNPGDSLTNVWVSVMVTPNGQARIKELHYKK